MARALRFAFGAALPLLLAAAAHAGSPVMTVDPLSLFFDTREVGTESDTFTVTIYNAPDGSPLSYQVNLTSGDTADFVLSCPPGQEDCLDRSLGSGFYQEIWVSFAPIAAGEKTATMTVSGNDSQNEFDDVELHGTAFEVLFISGFEPLDPDWSDCQGGDCTP